ncbi:2-succinyl-6-hydroxy-2,4-cyclohexadiene-1-carboxylate synthase [Bacillus sp. 165]|uniref:2-succinyl-6-hydroxy-2, 4-cyclohexadiene-1-carboxylate synthase n=1 Tax=Bacillus sp. 165 TaxID=1529117 RepID=UPI001ADCB64D|nr:2-succinyl-6-hydroxy-2,4-cyclohexadiene-1-carboxylate synthase [Bacillus sp. 165]MBO9130932.1 2-succinyl-6-hydroxy-2,4-cyclohexadiene-1-carboxylate synthase [Bacillus sp. 165]
MRQIINDVLYEYDVTGSGEPLLLLHGFTGDKTTWESFLTSWDNYTLITVDILGHGGTGSPTEAERYEIEKVAEDMWCLLDRMQIQNVHLLGYSMGGRLALTMACLYLERVTSLILESCTPGLETEQDKQARIHQDEALAKEIEENGLSAFMDYWENISLFASQKRLPREKQAAIRKQRLQNNATGLANSLRGMGTGKQPSWWEHLPNLTMPVLLLCGEYDEKFCRILKRMKELLPNAKLFQISEAGHAIHVEQTEKFDTIVREFLQ